MGTFVFQAIFIVIAVQAISVLFRKAGSKKAVENAAIADENNQLADSDKEETA